MEDNSKCIEIGRCNANEEKFAAKVPLTIPVIPPKPVTKEMTAKLSHEDKKLTLPPVPPSTSSNVELPEATDSKHLEQSIEPYQLVTSQPCNLEEFHKKYDFPQIVRVVHGYFGAREEDVISVGQELLLFFVKTSRVIVASSNQSKQHYYISLNSSLWFVPHYESVSDAITDSYKQCQQYRTVADLLKRKGEIPKVVKVCKTYNGTSPQSSVVAGELIFPKVLQTTSNRKRVLECLNDKKELLQLELACEGNFSVQPMDIKMRIEKFIQHFSTFPVSARVINDRKGALFSLSTGTVLSLKEFKTLQSYIFTTDIFGKRNYPLTELLMSVPIQIQCIEYPGLDIKPIYNAIRYTYENLPSVVKRKIFPTQNDLYKEELQNDDDTDIYDDLVNPSQSYEKIPENFRHAKDINHPYIIPVKNPPSFVVAPPVPPPRRTSDLSVTVKESFDNCTCHPVSVANTSVRRLSAPVLPTWATPYADINSSKESSSTSKMSVPQSKDNFVVSHLSTTKPQLDIPLSPPSANVTVFHSNKEKNLAYLKSLNLSDMLQLLDNMNLGEHKESFKDENIDGEMMIHLDRADLVDLGVNKRIQQTRLLQLIDGSVSAKKFSHDGCAVITTV